MLDREAYVSSNFSLDVCPICGGRFSRCGLPNHIRRHDRTIKRKTTAKRPDRKAAAWWEGWKEGYRAGLRDASSHDDEQS